MNSDYTEKLRKFDLKHLDRYEQMVFDDLFTRLGKVEALQVIINNTEGDFTQLSEKLAEIARSKEKSNMYYFCENFDKDQLAIINSDPEIKEAYETIKILSDDFTEKQEDALELDKMITTWLKKQVKSKPKPKKQTKPKPKKDPKPKGPEPRPVPKNEDPEPPKTKPGKKKKEDLIKELLEQLGDDQQVSAEQVEIIVKNILANRKVCFEDLCEDLVKAISETRNVKVHIPKMNTKGFKDETPNLLKIIDDIVLGNNVMLIGGAGTGKTFLAEKVSSVIGLEVEVINCNQFTSPIEINGGQTIEGYQEGKLIKAWSEGKLLILDELPKLDPNTAGILNEALAKTALPEGSERAYITNTRGDRFKKKQGFGVIATGNVYPNTESTAYGANNKQDLSLLDRFAGSVYEIEKNPEFEKKVILPNHLFIWGVADKIRTLVEVNKWEAQVSIRFMEVSLRAYLAEMEGVKTGEDMSDRKTYKSVVDSFLWTFTEVQQVEIKRAIGYDKHFAKFQYRNIDINKNPL